MHTSNLTAVEVASLYEAEQLRGQAVAADLPVPPFVQRIGLNLVIVHPERARADMRDLIDAHEINDRICKTCNGCGWVACPDCIRFDNYCPECNSTTEVRCEDCSGIDADHADAIRMQAAWAEQSARIAAIVAEKTAIVERIKSAYDDAALTVRDLRLIDGCWTVDGMPPEQWADAMYGDDEPADLTTIEA